tara:strand:- start:290 stop:1051 length:762 start_codon:yes stop_codon:yes gene_type:complete
MKEKNIILVAVRLKSKRLNKKALLKLYNKPLILTLTERLKKSALSSEIVWCTSTNINDQPLEDLAKLNKIKIFRGSEKDVMSRFIEVGNLFKASNIIRVTGDNPLTDPNIIDYMIDKHIDKKSEYTFCNTIPVGTRSEVISLKMLEKCHNLLQDPDSTEYMTWMLNRPDYFKVQELQHPNKTINRPEISLTVDDVQDYKNVSEIYDYFEGKMPNLDKIIHFIDSKPNLLKNLTKSKISTIDKNKINYNFKNDR